VTPSLDAQSALVAGRKLDRYELLCPIAEGGMASVWVARQRGKHGFAKLVAIKTILPKYAADPRFQKMFLDEGRIASRIEHLNVAHIFDLGEENDIHYLAMEYVEGEALSTLLRACQKRGIPMPLPIALRILADACAGLHEAHELKDAQGRPLEIVHRDVSPHNILVSTRGVAKLIDFGIAKARSRVGVDTNSGVLKGKVQYMSPEQALTNTVDRRSDVWSVGAVLYQLLSGRAPYAADTPLAALSMLRSGRPPAPLPPTVPTPIATLVRKALAFGPDNRFQSAAEMREAMEQVMTQLSLAAKASDVGAFVTEQVAERIERKRQEIDEAVAEAAERSRARGLSEAKVQALLSSAPVVAPAAMTGSEPATEAYAAVGLVGPESEVRPKLRAWVGPAVAVAGSLVLGGSIAVLAGTKASNDDEARPLVHGASRANALAPVVAVPVVSVPAAAPEPPPVNPEVRPTPEPAIRPLVPAPAIKRAARPTAPVATAGAETQNTEPIPAASWPAVKSTTVDDGF
jgi:serine/threonine-protein kinase